MGNNMSSGKILGAVLVLGAFAGGMYFGGSQNQAPVITKSAGGASYSGGYDKAADSDATDTSASTRVRYKSEVADRSIAGETYVVNDGDSIMSAVQKAKPGDTIQVMPGTYHETVYIDKDNISIIGVIQDSAETALNSSTDVVFTAAASHHITKNL